MKIVLDIETVQASRLEWARIHGIELAFPPGASSRDKTDLFSHAEYEEQLHKENEQYERSAFEPVYDTMAIWSNWDMRGPKLLKCGRMARKRMWRNIAYKIPL